MEDTISRQTAIGVIENEQMKIMRSEWAIDQAKFSAMSEIRALIADIPSASTEKMTMFERLWDVLYEWLNDTMLSVAPDETIENYILWHERRAQADILEEVMEYMLALESRREDE